MLSLSVFPLPIRFPSSASLLVPATQHSASSFPHFPAPPHSGFPGAPLPLTLPRFFPFVPAWFPMPCSRFSYSACCSFPFVPPGFAPTAVPPVLPFCFRFRVFPSLTLSFVRFSSVLTTQPPALSFPFFPLSPDGGSHGALSSSVRPVSMPSFRFRYSASCVSVLRFTVSCHRHYAASGLLFPARPFPFAFALGSGYLALVRSFSHELLHVITCIFICQQLFYFLLTFFVNQVADSFLGIKKSQPFS